MKEDRITIKEFFERVYDDIRNMGIREIIAVLILAIITTGIIVVCILGLSESITNEANKINSGIVVEKKYTAPHVYPQKIGEVTYYSPVPERFRLCIEGQKEGKTVQYWFSVPEAEYVSYEIGDEYPRRERTENEHKN